MIGGQVQTISFWRCRSSVVNEKGKGQISFSLHAHACAVSLMSNLAVIV